MTLQEFIPVWQAQPFRAFRVHSTRGVFDVRYPFAVTVLPTLQIGIVVAEGVAANAPARVEILALEEITRCEIIGEPRDMAAVMQSVPPEILGRDAQLLAAASNSNPNADDEPVAAAKPVFDPGGVEFLAYTDGAGRFRIQVVVRSREGKLLLSTRETGWNLQGVEPFENGTSFYFQHVDHPTLEQRVIVWPPDAATFESFAEAKKPAALQKELVKRDARLEAAPEKTAELPPDYFHGLETKHRATPPSEELDSRGEPAWFDPARHALEFESHEVGPLEWIQSPRIQDLEREEIIFDLSDTDWHADVTQLDAIWRFALRRTGGSEVAFTLEIDVWTRWARLDNESGPVLPLEFVERHLRNFALHDSADSMLHALRAGPRDTKTPDVRVDVPTGYAVEFWRGAANKPLPFLQPRFLDAQQRTVLDLRGTAWAASMRAEPRRPVVTLRLLADERPGVDREGALDLTIRVDLEAQWVACRELEGSTSLGRFQALLRRVRGTKWLREELTEVLGRGRWLSKPETLQ